MKNIMIIGATSAIAEAVARIYAARGNNLYLVARNKDRLDTLKNDFLTRGANSVQIDLLDVNDFDKHTETVDKAFSKMGHIDTTLIAHGTLPDQASCEKSFKDTLFEINTNAISTISFLTHIANIFESQKSGTVAVITSVAGDRGRQSNYIYGACKGMVSTYLQGLRNRLYKSDVAVLDIKPGFVDTPMTKEFDKGPLWAKPEKVGKQIVKAIETRKNYLYTPNIWFYIMLIIKLIPEKIFKRLTL